jgi:hypothetical protein
MLIPIGARVKVRENHIGYSPHLENGQEYEVVGMQGKLFQLDRCSGPKGPLCSCVRTGWAWDAEFELVRKSPLVPGDVLIATRNLGVCFMEGDRVTVKSVINYLQFKCKCRQGDGHEGGYDDSYAYVWTQITAAEAALAKDLPSIEDVIEFMRRKP